MNIFTIEAWSSKETERQIEYQKYIQWMNLETYRFYAFEFCWYRRVNSLNWYVIANEDT